MKKHAKKRILALRVFSIIVILTNVFFPALKASADQSTSHNFGTEFLTNASLLDKDGKVRDKFNIHDDMSASWAFNIPSESSVKAGDTFEIPIPSQIALDSDVSFPVLDGSGAIIANAVADHNTQKIVVTLTNNAVSTHPISGKINLSVRWNQTVVETNQTTHVEWGFNNLSNDYFVTGGTINPNELLTKGGYYDKIDSSKINWDVRINYAKILIQNAVYTDILGENQILDKNSVTAYVVNYNSDGSFSIINSIPSSQISYDNDSKFHITLGNIQDQILVRYSAIATDSGKSKNYSNSGLLTGDNITSQSVNVYTPNRGGDGTGDTNVNISGQKTWNDHNNQDGIRPEEIKVNLLADGKIVQTKTVNAKEGWKYTFQDLPKYQDGKAIKYTISEEAVKGYTSEIDGYNLTNSYTPANMVISGQKTWNDHNNQDGIRPEEIKVNLLADGKIVQTKTVNAKEGWKYTFQDLPKYQDGKAIKYTISEEAVKGYTSEIDGYNLTNSYTPANMVISGQKTWNDHNNQDGIRPEEIKVNLLADGKIVQTKTVNAKEGWKYTFQDLPKYQDGKAIKYTISEEAVKGYTSEIDGYNLTNRHIPNAHLKPIKPFNPMIPDTPFKPNYPNITPERTNRQAELPHTGVQNIVFFPILLMVLTMTIITLIWYQIKYN